MKRCITIIILILFVHTYTYRGNAAENLSIFRFDGRKDFTDGLNTAHSPNLLINQSSILTNWATDDKLGLVKRDGYVYADTLPGSASESILNTYTFVKDDGSSYVIVHKGSSIYSTPELGTTWNTVVSGISSKYPFRFATHFNKVFGTNGVNTVFSWDGNTYTSYPDIIPRALYPLSANGRLWMGSTIDNPNYVYFSEINVDPITTDDWDTSVNAIEFGLGDGQVIKGLDFQRGIIWVYKDRSTYGIRDITNKYLAIADYGTVSQFSSNGYGNGKIFLDKTGFYYFGGGNITYLSESINNLLNGIGLVGSNSGRISATSSTDFSTGTFSNCYNNSGTIEISTQSKIWTSQSDFNASGYGGTQHKITNNIGGEIQISTSTGSGDTKVSLTFEDVSPTGAKWNGGVSKVNYATEDVNKYGAAGGSSWNKATDDDPLSFVALVNIIANNQWSYARFNINNAVATRISRISVKYQWALYDDVNTNIYVYDGLANPHADIIGAEIFTSKSDLSDIYRYPYIFNTSPIDIGTPGIADINIKNDYSTIYGSDDAGLPEVIGLNFATSADYVALKIYDVSAFTVGTNTVYYTSATYIAPPFDSGQTSTQYQFLYPSDSLGVGTSSGTINYWTRTATTSGGLSSATKYYLGIASATNTAIDGNQWFQWGAELFTSSITATPIIYDATLQYATSGYATYTSKVFNVSNKLTSWGSFISDDEGTVTYQIRGATWSFGGGETTLAGSQSSQWSNINSGDDITLSTAITKIQFKFFLNSKNAKVKGINATWGENTNAVGGNQEVSSMFANNRYYFACSTWTNHNDIVLIYNKNKAWELWDNYPVSSFFKFNNNYYFASSTQPVICKMFSGNSSDNAVWKSPHTDLGLSDIDKQIRYAYITCEPKTGSFCYFKYETDFSTITKTVYVDLSGISRNKRVEFDTGYYGKNFYFTVSSTSTAKPEIQYIDIYYQTEFKLR